MHFHIEENSPGTGKESEEAHLERCRNAEETTSQQGSPSVEHKVFSFKWIHIHACRANSLSLPPYYKLSIPPWLLYHSPTLFLMILRKNSWPNPRLSHLVWERSDHFCVVNANKLRLSSFTRLQNTIQLNISRGLNLEASVTGALHSRFQYMKSLIMPAFNQF